MSDKRLHAYAHRQHLFRLPLFLKYDRRWRPRWKSALRGLLHLYERTHGNYNAASMRVTPHQERVIRQLLESLCSRREMKIIEQNLQHAQSRGRTPAQKRKLETEQLIDELFVEYRKAYALATRAVNRAFARSDFRWKHEFLAVDLGFVRTDDYERR